MVSVDVKHHDYLLLAKIRAEDLRGSRGGRPGLPVPNGPYGLCGRRATLNLNNVSEFKNYVKLEVAVLGSRP